VSTPYAGPSPYPSPSFVPVKKRPRAWWFAVGGVLMVAAIVVFGISLARFLHTIAHTDARFPAAGAHQVRLPPHVQRGVYGVAAEPRPRCSAIDGSGATIHFHTPDGTFTYDQWTALVTFDTGDGQVTFTCSHRAGITDLRVAQIPSGGDLARLGLLGVAVPLLLGGVGFLVVLIAGILWFTRRAPRPGPPGGPPPGSYAAPVGYPPAPPPGG
jgi:uncharacterized iron-regulated membrane protein